MSKEFWLFTNPDVNGIDEKALVYHTEPSHPVIKGTANHVFSAKHVQDRIKYVRFSFVLKNDEYTKGYLDACSRIAAELKEKV